jgi:hypothetical protein
MEKILTKVGKIMPFGNDADMRIRGYEDRRMCKCANMQTCVWKEYLFVDYK